MGSANYETRDSEPSSWLGFSDPELTETLLSTIFASALSGIILADKQGMIVGWNQASQKIFGYTPQEVRGKSLEILVPSRYMAAHREGYAHFVATGEGVVLNRTLEMSALRKDGSEFPCELSINPVIHAGNETLIVAFIRDITERHQAALQAREHADHLSRLENSRRDFMNTAAHELRGPLSVIGGYVDMLPNILALNNSDSTANAISVMGEKCRALNLLIDDLLQSARLEDAAQSLDLQEVEINKLLSGLVDSLKDNAGPTHNLKLISSLPFTLVADSNKLKYLFGNLLMNAINYSPSGGDIEIVITTFANEVKVAITDHGIGIKHEDLPLLFQRFNRLKDPRAANVGGTGLGLYIAQQAAALHNAQITVESEIGKGSCFTVTLPRFLKLIKPHNA